MRILVAGASGLIGNELVERLTARGDEVVRLVRREIRGPDEVRWDARSLDPSVVDGFDGVVNLCGATVGRIPWTPAYRRVLLESRVHPTVGLAEAIVASARPPAVFVSGSAIGIYGNRPGELLDESSPTGEGFFPDLCRAWEAASAIAAGTTRVVNPRSAVVIAHGGGMAPVRLLTAFGLGAGYGRGDQAWPWISLHDEVSALMHLLFSKLSGPVILASPTPATSDEVTEAFAHVMHRPHLLRIPSIAVKALGEAGTRLLLDDIRVVPAKLTADGFVWAQPTIDEAVSAIG
ncbi:MAG TPA: TIGR01777 family oxidoreductase [Pseudolysinimonas sp.]|nr:TIGR01777 family oxidoreductase [Pseudolysinimonas sp.]